MPTQDPTEVDVIRAFVREGIAKMHTSIPATVITYDPTTQKADVQPTIRPRIDDPLADVERPTLEPIAPIPNVPVWWPSSSLGSITFGLAPGDPVTLLIAERSTDEWRSLGLPDVSPLDSRRFDLSDAIAFPGGRSFNSANPATGPLTIAVDVDATGAVVINSTLPVAGIKLGGATTAIESAIKGDIFETDLTAWLAGLDVLLTALATPPLGFPLPPTLAQVGAWIGTVNLAAGFFQLGSHATFKAAVLSGIHRSLKVKVDP